MLFNSITCKFRRFSMYEKHANVVVAVPAAVVVVIAYYKTKRNLLRSSAWMNRTTSQRARKMYETEIQA